jgi:hypothetical protein
MIPDRIRMIEKNAINTAGHVIYVGVYSSSLGCLHDSTTGHESGQIQQQHKEGNRKNKMTIGTRKKPQLTTSALTLFCISCPRTVTVSPPLRMVSMRLSLN